MRKLVWLGCLIFPFLGEGGVQVYKDFSAGGEEVVESVEIPGTSLEAGGREWSSHGSVYRGEGNDLRSETTGSASFRLYQEVDTIRASAVLNTSDVEWVSLAFGGDLGEQYFQDVQLAVFVRDTGAYEVRADGVELVVVSDWVPEFKREKTEVELIYKAATNRVSLRLNGKVVLAGRSLEGFRPEIDRVGVRFHRVREGAGPSVSELVVEVDGEAKPELSIETSEYRVFETGEELEAKVRLFGVESGSTLSLSAVDFYGNRVWEETVEIGEEEAGATVRRTLPSSEWRGYFQLGVELLDESGTREAVASEAVVFIPQPPEETRTDENPFGAMVRAHGAYPLREKELDVWYMRRIGLRYVRSHRFNLIHARGREEDSLRWEEMEEEAALYREKGLRIVATTGWPIPNWASGAVGKETKQQISLFAPSEMGMAATQSFLSEMAERFGDEIAYYQIGNEVDASSFWLGGFENQKNHDVDGIIRDFFEYFVACVEAIRVGDPDAKVAPSTTSRMDGHTYRPWLTTMLDMGVGPFLGAYGTHYSADLEYVLERFREFEVPTDLPILITEIGGMSRIESGNDPFGDEMKMSIRNDYLQMVSQYSSPANVRAMCKFLLREEPTYGHEGTIVAGILGLDFTLRPSFASYAILVRHLAGSDPVGELNVVRRASRGWARGFSFEKSGESFHILFLFGSERAEIRLDVVEGPVTLVDVMGNEREIEVVEGEAKFVLDPVLPVIVKGNVRGDEGALVLPAETLLSESSLTLKNPKFEQGMVGWRMMTNEKAATANPDERFSVSVVDDVVGEGERSVYFDAPAPTQWYGISQDIDLSEVPKPADGEYLKFHVRMKVKGEAVEGKGLGYTLAFRDAGYRRFYFNGSSYFGFGGTFDWKWLDHELVIPSWPAGTEKLTLDILMGLATGELWVDDVSVDVEHWKMAGPPEESEVAER